MTRRASSGRRVIVAALAALLTLVAGCGPGAGPDDRTPGFEDAARPLDTSPFTMAGPRNTSPLTTISGLAEALDLSDGNSPSALTTIPAVTTTTIPVADVPDLNTIGSVCGFAETVKSFAGLRLAPPASVEGLASDLIPALATYRSYAPEAMQPDIDVIIAEVTKLRAALQELGWDARSPAFSEAIAAMVGDPNEPGSFGARLDRVDAAETPICG